MRSYSPWQVLSVAVLYLPDNELSYSYCRQLEMGGYDLESKLVVSCCKDRALLPILCFVEMFFNSQATRIYAWVLFMWLDAFLKSWYGNLMLFSVSSNFAEPWKQELLNAWYCSLFWKKTFPLCHPQSVNNFVCIFPSWCKCLQYRSQFGCLVFVLVCEQPALCIFLPIQNIQIHRTGLSRKHACYWQLSEVVLRGESLSCIHHSSLVAWQSSVQRWAKAI